MTPNGEQYLMCWRKKRDYSVLTATSRNVAIIGAEQALQEKGPNWVENSSEGKGSESAGGQELMLSQQRSLAARRGNAPRGAPAQTAGEREGIVLGDATPVCLASETGFWVLHWNLGSLVQERYPQTGELLVELQRRLENRIIELFRSEKTLRIIEFNH